MSLSPCHSDHPFPDPLPQEEGDAVGDSPFSCGRGSGGRIEGGSSLIKATLVLLAALRAVFDTNIVVPALVFGQRLPWLRRAWANGIAIPVACRETTGELLRVLR